MVEEMETDAGMEKRMQYFRLACAALLSVGVAFPAWAGWLDLSDITHQLNANAAAIHNAQQSAQAAAPLNIQPLLDKIFIDLSKLPDERLYVLNAAPDVCMTPAELDCRGVPTATVKPFVAMALDRRKAEHADRATQQSLYVSAGGFGVSVLSLFLSAYGFAKERRRRR
jgi:hypothetical protein